MKKKTAAKKAKKTVAKRPIDLIAEIKELKNRDMRLTSEIDRLGTEVAGLSALVGRIYGALQIAKVMPYDPIMEVSPLKIQPMPIKTPEAIVAEKGQVKFGVHHSGSTRTYTVRAMLNETTLGYLSIDGDITIKPEKIQIFGREEDVKNAIDAVKIPEGKKVAWKVEPHV